MIKSELEEFILSVYEQIPSRILHYLKKKSYKNKLQDRVDDIANDVVLYCYKYRTSYELKNAPLLLYYGIRSVVYDYYQKETKNSPFYPKVDIDEEENSRYTPYFQSTDRKPDEELEQEMLTELLHGKMSKIPPNQRAVLTLRYLKGWKPNEVAEKLAMHQKQVYNLIYLGLRNLKRSVQK